MKNKFFAILVSGIIWTSCNHADHQSNKNGQNHHKTIDIEQEKSAIMDVLDLENKAYREKDFETWKSTYVQEEYIKNWGFWEGYDIKVMSYNSWNDLLDKKKGKFEGEVENTWKQNTKEIIDLNIQVRSNVAWVTYKQKNIDSETKKLKSQSLETRILEKINGSWKIAYVNFLYLPKAKKGIE